MIHLAESNIHRVARIVGQRRAALRQAGVLHRRGVESVVVVEIEPAATRNHHIIGGRAAQPTVFPVEPQASAVGRERHCGRSYHRLVAAARHDAGVVVFRPAIVTHRAPAVVVGLEVHHPRIRRDDFAAVKHLDGTHQRVAAVGVAGHHRHRVHTGGGVNHRHTVSREGLSHERAVPGVGKARMRATVERSREEGVFAHIGFLRHRHPGHRRHGALQPDILKQ